MKTNMGLRSWMMAASRLLKTAKKPGKTEYWLLFRICLLGIAVVGAIGFVIKYIFTLVNLTG
ncbi:MAG: protein translocase SEC61 complex subunit gamma [Candidatus Bathyarchaeota archaeon]